MSIPNSNSKFISMLLVLISLFIFVFFTQGYYGNLIASMASFEENESTYMSKVNELDTLNKKSKELKSLEGASDNEIGKYLKKLDEDELIREIYAFAESYSENGVMKILSLSMTEGSKSESGFDESKVNISARVQNEKVMIDFLDFLITKSQYKFFMNSFQVPKTQGKAFNINVPLTFLYKEIKQEVKEVEKK